MLLYKWRDRIKRFLDLNCQFFQIVRFVIHNITKRVPGFKGPRVQGFACPDCQQGFNLFLNCHELFLLPMKICM
jgi:transposase-like protein